MPQRIESNFSDEDARLIEANQLGSPLGIYRLKPGLIRFFHRIGLALVIMGVVILVIVIILGLIAWHQSLVLHQQHIHNLTEALQLQEEQEQVDHKFGVLFSPLLGGLFGLLGGLLCLHIGVPQVRRARVIVCEHGILQIENNRVEVVRWEDILAIREGLIGLEYFIERREGETLTLSSFYKDSDEIVALIRQRSGVA